MRRIPGSRRRTARLLCCRKPGGLRSKRIRAHSTHLRERSSVVFATEPMDDNPRWRLLDAGELVHVDAALRVNRSLVLPDPPRHPIRREDLSEPVLHAQHTSA